MKAVFKVAWFHFGNYMWGLQFLLGIVIINLAGQYYLRVSAVESTVRVSGSVLLILYAGYHSMDHFGLFQSWHLPRRQFFFANAAALLATTMMTMLIGPTLAGVLGAVLPIEYLSILEPWFAGLDAAGGWAVLLNFNMYAFTTLVLWLLVILHYRGWFWKSTVGVISLATLARLSLGAPLDSAFGEALRFFFVGMIDDRTNIGLASINLTLGALMCAGACYLLLRRTPIR